MLPIFSKQIDEIDAEDVQALLGEEYPEDVTVEYKGQLPHNKSGKHPWYEGGSDVRNYTRNQLLEEVVAFANSQGGTLLVGVEETSDRPPRADSLNPVPRCHEFADRLRKQIRGCIDPKIPTMSVRGISLNAEGQGIVLVRVPQSRKAPHRLEVNNKCYVRRHERTESMTMREIQELTLQKERQQAELDQRFQERQDEFHKYLKDADDDLSEIPVIGVRHTLLPTSGNPHIENIFEVGLEPRFVSPTATIGNDNVKLKNIERAHQSRPILGGVQYESVGSTTIRVTITRDGMIEYVLRAQWERSDHVLHPDWFIALAMNAMLTTEQFRNIAGNPDIEYGLESEIASIPKEPVEVAKLTQPSRRMGVVRPIPLKFDRLSVGSAEEFNKVLRVLYRDLSNAAGSRIEGELEVSIPESTPNQQ